MEVSLHETAIAQETVYEARRHAILPTRPFTLFAQISGLAPLRGRPSFSKATWKRWHVFNSKAIFFEGCLGQAMKTAQELVSLCNDKNDKKREARVGVGQAEPATA